MVICQQWNGFFAFWKRVSICPLSMTQQQIKNLLAGMLKSLKSASAELCEPNKKWTKFQNTINSKGSNCSPWQMWKQRSFSCDQNHTPWEQSQGCVLLTLSKHKMKHNWKLIKNHWLQGISVLKDCCNLQKHDDYTGRPLWTARCQKVQSQCAILIGTQWKQWKPTTIGNDWDCSLLMTNIALPCCWQWHLPQHAVCLSSQWWQILQWTIGNDSLAKLPKAFESKRCAKQQWKWHNDKVTCSKRQKCNLTQIANSALPTSHCNCWLLTEISNKNC